MKINIEINNLIGAAADGKLIKGAALVVIEGETKRLSDDRDIEVSIAIIGPKKIREINKKYRKKDQVTDVLSFTEDDFTQGKSDMPRILGELVICAQQVKADSKEANVSPEYELAWVTVHGMLHLFGYDHETSEKDVVLMRQKEQFYLSRCKNVF
ncbi:MAG: rRNA maturation RNase YbeY [Candidatus Paceibacterota bacterium]